MKINMRKLTTRSVLGIVSLSLIASSVFALALFSQSFAPQTISNPANLTPGCATVTDSVANNGTSGGHEMFTLDYSCGGGALTSTSQSVLSVVTSASFVDTYTIDTSASTATITSTSLSLLGNSIQNGALFCNASTPSYILISGNTVALSSSAGCQNGSSNAVVNIYWYRLTIIVSTHGTVSVAGFNIVWTDS